MAKKIILFVILCILILDLSQSTSFISEYVLFVISIIFSVYIISLKNKINTKVLLFSLAWLLINFLVYAMLGKQLLLLKSIRFITNFILLPYFLHVYYGKIFLFKLEKIVFFLTAISLPLYLLNILFLKSFNSLASPFETFTNPDLLDNPNYWSIGLYTNGIEQIYGGISVLRNCGFMWEPGYFAVIIIWAMMFHWLISGVKIDKKTIIYSTAILTTFSTSGYLALFVLLSSIFLKNVSFAKLSLLFVFIYTFVFAVYSLDFVGGKIESNLQVAGTSEFNYDPNYKAVKLNRIQIAKYDLVRVYKYPWGFGHYDRLSFEGVDVIGTNGLTGLLRIWGVPVFFYIMYCLIRYLKIFNLGKNNPKILFLFFTALLIVFFSQSVHYNILPYLLIVSSMTFIPEKDVSRREF
jgi:hypothetical protein